MVAGRTLNGQPLLEFPMSSGEPALGPFKIKRATLWARVKWRHSHHYQHHKQSQSNQRNITLWVFRVRCGNTTHLRGKVSFYFQNFKINTFNIINSLFNHFENLLKTIQYVFLYFSSTQKPTAHPTLLQFYNLQSIVGSFEV